MSNRFDLRDRVPRPNLFNSIEMCREHSRTILTLMRIPVERILSILDPFCKEGTHFVEVGSGVGLVSLILGGRHPNVKIQGIEGNSLLYDVSDENKTFAFLVNSPAKVDFMEESLTDLPIDDKYADVVFSFYSFSRWDDPVKTLQECNRICKPEGIVVIYDLARDADEGMIAFVIQHVSSELVIDALRSSYNVAEVEKIIREAHLENWKVSSEALNFMITSKEIKMAEVKLPI